MDTAQVVKDVIRYNHHMVIATADNDGKPWVSPVFYMYDERFVLYWVSDKAARHSRNICTNPRVAITIYGPARAEEPDRIHGVYIDARAEELTDAIDIECAAGIIQQRSQPDKFTIKSLSDITGNAAWRIYRAVPKQVSKRRDAIDKASGQTISIRTPVIL